MLENNKLHFAESIEVDQFLQGASQLSGANTPFNLQKFSNFSKFQYFTLFRILGRAHSMRTHNELRYLADFARENPILKELSEINGSEFSKGILRSATLEQFQPGQIIVQRKQTVQRIYIVLEGKIGSIKNENQTDMIGEMSLRTIYENLTQMARREAKKNTRLTRKMSSYRQEYQNNHQVYKNWENAQILEHFERQTTFGDKARCIGNQHVHTAISLETTLLLSVDLKNMVYWLNHCYNSKIEVSYKLLREHSCFSCLSDEILEQVVGFLVVVPAHKGDIVYEQGSQSDKIYFLEQGQLKIQKCSKLFMENPNSLYLDRRKLMSQRQLLNNEYLPYADFHLLYNYRPTVKTIQLGILTPFSIFGEEDIIESRPRQTTVRCVSQKAVYFQIELKKLHQTLKDNYQVFLRGVRESLTQKVRYRQNAYAAMINFQNKSKLKYFFQGDSVDVKDRKNNLKKINDKIKQHSASARTKLIESGKEGDEDSPTKMIVSEILNAEEQVPVAQIPASFNSFNFHRMLRTKLKKITIQAESSSSQEQKQEKGSTIKEQKIINNSHTWRLVRDKVMKERALSNRIGSYKHNIDFQSPLIDEQYFRQIESEMKRLEREKRAGLTNLSFFQNKSKARPRIKSVVTVKTHR